MNPALFDTLAVAYVENKNIDRAKWDHCIKKAGNGTIYGFSFFLDALCKHWDALVMNDYEMVMPLPWNKKYGYAYLYQPYFLQHLAVFGNKINTSIVAHLLIKIPKHFKYWDIDWKEEQIDISIIEQEGLQAKKRRNYFLSLHESYETIEKNYKRLAKRMLRKATENNIDIIRNAPPEEVIHFYKINYQGKQKNIKTEDYERLITATTKTFERGNATTYLAKNANGKILAAYLVLKDEHYVYSLVGGSNEEGKKNGAFFLLTDAAIKDHADSNKIFRFEGSDKKGIALFNSQFNSKPVVYYHLKLNRLPWFAKLLKK